MVFVYCMLGVMAWIATGVLVTALAIKWKPDDYPEWAHGWVMFNVAIWPMILLVMLLDRLSVLACRAPRWLAKKLPF